MVYLLIVLGIFVLEYNLKNYTDSHRIQGAKEEYFGGKLILRNYHNSEGGFGIFKKNPQLGVKISGVVLVCVIWEFVKALFGGAAALVKLGLSFAAGGGLSNYYDRVT
ncbi:MAG: signal peptidase II, partial [Clostridiales bacterium]|nr:signal peptidase II [Clostridiales bacterium]